MTSLAAEGYPFVSELTRTVRLQDPLLQGRRRLCSAVEALTPVSHFSDAHREMPIRETLHETPWVTPLLGTGCLELGDGPVVSFKHIPDVAARVLAKLKTPFPAALGDPGAMAKDFARGLFLSHDRQPTDDPGSAEPSERAVHLLLICALATQLYHGARLGAVTPVGRRVSLERGVIMGDGVIDVALRDTVLPTTIALLALLEDRPGVDSREIPTNVLSRQMQRRLGGTPKAVHLSDLRLLTDVTWLELTKDTAIYPGWSDLLLRLLLGSREDAETDSIDELRGSRPELKDIETLGGKDLDSAVAELLEDPSTNSWSSRESREPLSERDRFYSAVASLIHEQARVFALVNVRDPLEIDEDEYPEQHRLAEQLYARKVRVDAAIEADARTAWDTDHVVDRLQVPHPVAFSTSFDVELEMALWKLGKPFRVVMPVLATLRKSVVNLVWLSAKIDPQGSHGARSGLDSLRNGEHEWAVASEVLTSESGGDLPIVVRLSGSPLMKLPPELPPNSSIKSSGPRRAGQKVRLHHALTVDEYTSIRQSEHELSAALSKGGFGLPGCLVSGTDTNRRIWLGLAVQIDDPAIRSRMFSQLSSGSAIRSWDTAGTPGEVAQQRARVVEGGTAVIERPSAAASVTGIAVNRRLDEAEAVALSWLGFQFAVNLDCSKLTRDLEHCARHAHALYDAASTAAEALSQTDPEEGETPKLSWCRSYESRCDHWPSNEDSTSAWADAQ